MDPQKAKPLIVYLILVDIVCLPIWGMLLDWWHFPGPVGRALMVLFGAPVILASAAVALTAKLSGSAVAIVFGCFVVFIYWSLMLLPGLAWFLNRKKSMLWLQAGLLATHLGVGGLILIAMQKLD